MGGAVTAACRGRSTETTGQKQPGGRNQRHRQARDRGASHGCKATPSRTQRPSLKALSGLHGGPASQALGGLGWSRGAERRGWRGPSAAPRGGARPQDREGGASPLKKTGVCVVGASSRPPPRLQRGCSQPLLGSFLVGGREGKREESRGEEGAGGRAGGSAPTARGPGRSRVLEWIAISFSRGSSRRRDRTCVS